MGTRQFPTPFLCTQRISFPFPAWEKGGGAMNRSEKCRIVWVTTYETVFDGSTPLVPLACISKRLPQIQGKNIHFKRLPRNVRTELWGTYLSQQGILAYGLQRKKQTGALVRMGKPMATPAPWVSRKTVANKTEAGGALEENLHGKEHLCQNRCRNHKGERGRRGHVTSSTFPVFLLSNRIF